MKSQACLDSLLLQRAKNFILDFYKSLDDKKTEPEALIKFKWIAPLLKNAIYSRNKEKFIDDIQAIISNLLHKSVTLSYFELGLEILSFIDDENSIKENKNLTISGSTLAMAFVFYKGTENQNAFFQKLLTFPCIQLYLAEKANNLLFEIALKKIIELNCLAQDVKFKYSRVPSIQTQLAELSKQKPLLHGRILEMLYEAAVLSNKNISHLTLYLDTLELLERLKFITPCFDSVLIVNSSCIPQNDTSDIKVVELVAP